MINLYIARSRHDEVDVMPQRFIWELRLQSIARNWHISGDVRFSNINLVNDSTLEADSNLKYYYYTQDIWQDADAIFLSDRIRSDINKGNCKILLDDSLEGHNHIWQDLLKKFNVEKHQLIFLSGRINIDQVQDINGLYINTWEKQVMCLPLENDIRYKQFSNKQIDMIENKVNRKYYCSMYIRRPKFHRVVLLIYLHQRKLLENMLWSFGATCEGRKLSSNKYISFFDAEYKNSIEEVMSWGNCLPEIAEWEVDLNYNLANINQIDLIHPLNSYYHMVSETCSHEAKNMGGPNTRNCFFSEKTFKPMATMQPFVMHGDYLSIQNLKTMGYKTFDKWIDHSYDSIVDFKSRTYTLGEEIYRLNNISYETWSEMLYEMKEDLIYNKENLKLAWTRSNIDKLP